MVHLCCAEQFAEEGEELVDVFSSNAFAVVHQVHGEHRSGLVKCHNDAHQASMCKLQGVFDQVDQNLLQSNVVADQGRWERVIWHHSFVVVVANGPVENIRRDCLHNDLRSHHVGLGLKHVNDEVHDLPGVETFELGLKHALLNELQVEHIVHEAKEQVKLRDN